MPKNDNPHALRLINALRAITDDETAAAFADTHPLSKSADINRKFNWAQEICTALEDQLSRETSVAIRRSCCCGDGKTMAKEIADAIRKAGSLPEGCMLFSEKNRYAFLEYVSERELIFGYHTCVCSCIKRVERTLPLLWCECSAGYAEALFRQVFGDSVQVTLLTSAKSGSDRCSFRIRW